MNIPLKSLIGRNVKLYFKDKSMFFPSLLSPLILLVLFLTFLAGVYEDSFLSFIPKGITVSDKMVSSFTVSWLLSSLIGVSAVTVAFCSNIVMAQDKVEGSVHDLLVAPIKKSTLAISYFIANIIATGIICFVVCGVGFAYISTIGWYFSLKDVLLIILDVFISVIFGCSFAAIVGNFVSTQGGIGAVSSLVSALYGFICGAYMPISQFGEPIQKVISFLPGTYGVGLLRNHYMGGVLSELENTLPSELMKGLKDGFDANLYFFDTKVEVWQMYTVVLSAIFVMIGGYIIINKFKTKEK